ncbi:3-hydroxyacyl-CoA dehydrogenase family protein [Jidongwangia harbinensis]|uniref:3-hydroxyacyl-CoA dehydrogenase family protein n=1 Tax=Jidongwangia harbinensis TaxID=2878561 RepID=UPI001CDA0E04|nr:3-hydroxyacyl-CoA dehydrogenase family protein [Jidongwangia harbinensis]MCA2217199.1 3-hydroxyacyl-CoA dehydrogenase family protein [Jidongwangia harbinensis]
MHPATETIAIIGAGVMGCGIAAMALGEGVDVILIDISDDALKQAPPTIDKQLRHGRMMDAFPASRRPGTLTTGSSHRDAAGAGAVIEAITEDTALKADVLARVSTSVEPGTLLISNTSGIPIAELARSVRHPAEFCGAHFMNPSYLIRMVEVIRGPQTSDATIEAMVSLLTRMSRTPAVVNDAPGFVTSRLLHPMINEAARIVAAGTADPASVDALMQGCLGHPTGPLRTADLIGIDNLVDALRALSERTGDASHAPCDLLVEKVRRHELGQKTGRGFFDYGKVLS